MAAFGELGDEAVLAVYADADRRAGEREAAFHELVARHQHRLFAVCVRVLGSPADAEEAVQEVFVRLARHADRFRGEARLSTWLYRVAHNVCTDLVRHDARRPSTPVDDIAAVADEPAADDVVGARETAIGVEAALRRLDERSRTLLLLVAVEGLTYAEAAEATGLPVGTVKSRVSRARVQLGELLGGDDRSSPSPPDAPRASGSDPSGEIEARGPPR